jgi:cysteinyl-tRNA synthetase
MIKVTNNLTRKKEVFIPLEDKKVKLYVCGITPYDYAHVGHGRCYVTFDLLYRLLEFLGYTVTYCRNYTDVDDKLIEKAQKELGDGQQFATIASRYIATFKEDITALNCVAPTYEPRVTEHIPEIIEFIAGLIAAGMAYEVDGNVYFSIAQFCSYGQLSGHKLEDLRAGARVDIEKEKKDPLDFALWKKEKPETFWKSPWGYGRPGWHIECSALAARYLGKQIDIHAGGMDLLFPHHENEIAQSEGLFKLPFARYWMHNGFVQINKEKMSKSLGNFFTLREIFKQCDPMVVRYYFLNHQYRAPLDFSFDDLESIKKSYQKIVRALQYDPTVAVPVEVVKQSTVVQKMLAFVQDDLNSAGMMGVLFEELPLIAKNNQERNSVGTFLYQVLGLTLEPLAEKKVVMSADIITLMRAREQARLQKDWARADAIRDQLQALGVDVHDKKI